MLKGWPCAIFLWLIVLSPPLFGQRSIESVFGEPVHTIELDSRRIESMETDQEGNLYLLSPSRHRLFKYYSNSRYDSLQTIGGKGIEEEGFNYPTKIMVPNRQSVFILDELNRRIVQLNTNLKLTQETNFLTLRNEVPDSDFGDLLPVSFTVGPTGELFLLNQEDLKVWKFTIDGNLETTFAGLDYGEGSVVEPCDIAINRESNVFLIDCEDQSIPVYDLYGIFQYRISVRSPFFWTKAKVFASTIIYFDQTHLFFFNTFTKKTGPYLQTDQDIIDLAFNGELMFVLFENRINLYRIK